MLPSQTPRPKSRRSNMHRKRSRRGSGIALPFRKIGIVIVVAGLGTGVVYGLNQVDFSWPRSTNGEELVDATTIEKAEQADEARRTTDPLRPGGMTFPPAVALDSTDTRTPRTDRKSTLANRRPAPASITMGQPAEAPTGDVQAGKPSNGGQSNAGSPQRQPAQAHARSVPKTPARQIDPAPARSRTSRPASAASTPQARQAVRRGMDELARGELVEARLSLSRALGLIGLAEPDAERVRGDLQRINQQLVFSPHVAESDPFTMSYEIRSGDSLQQITRRVGLQVDWRFIRRISGIADERRIRPGQRIKLITGPFHAVVHKRSYRMDIYLGELKEAVYMGSFPVGLGEFDSTPTGRFEVRKNSKLINPRWTNPRTGERFSADDPDNPIGERWIGLQGVDPANENLMGYGIHGTVDPDSIGSQASMGCVRMRHEDVEIVYELLMVGASTIVITD